MLLRNIFQIVQGYRLNDAIATIACSDMQVAMYHGQEDDIAPISNAKQTFQRLHHLRSVACVNSSRENGITWHEYEKHDHLALLKHTDVFASRLVNFIIVE